VVREESLQPSTTLLEREIAMFSPRRAHFVAAPKMHWTSGISYQTIELDELEEIRVMRFEPRERRNERLTPLSLYEDTLEEMMDQV
jgi:hypothetical protein